MRSSSCTAIVFLLTAGTAGITQAEEPAKIDAVNIEVAAVAPVPEESLWPDETEYKTRIIVKNVAVAYLLVIYPNGQKNGSGYRRGTNQEFHLSPFPYVDYCWSDKKLPEDCPPQFIGRLNPNQTTIF
jgi:hypothetical protein